MRCLVRHICTCTRARTRPPAHARPHSRARLRREAAAAAAAAAVGVSKAQGRAWLEAARDGRVAELQALLAANPALLGYQVRAIDAFFVP